MLKKENRLNTIGIFEKAVVGKRTYKRVIFDNID